MFNGQRFGAREQTEALLVGADLELSLLVAADDFATKHEDVLHAGRRGGLGALVGSKEVGLSAFGAIATHIGKLRGFRLKSALARLVTPRELADGRASSGQLPLFRGRERGTDPRAEGSGLRGRHTGDREGIGSLEIEGVAREAVGESA